MGAGRALADPLERGLELHRTYADFLAGSDDPTVRRTTVDHDLTRSSTGTVHLCRPGDETSLCGTSATQHVEDDVESADPCLKFVNSSTRVTQDIYIHVRDDMYDRFYDATI